MVVCHVDLSVVSRDIGIHSSTVLLWCLNFIKALIGDCLYCSWGVYFTGTLLLSVNDIWRLVLPTNHKQTIMHPGKLQLRRFHRKRILLRILQVIKSLFNILAFHWSCQAINFFNHINRTINFFIRALITVLTHILFVTFFNLFVFHLQVDVVGPLLLNASLLLVLTTDYSDWLVQVTELTDIDNDGVFWVLTIAWIILNWLIKLTCWFYLISEIKFKKLKKWTVAVFSLCFH